MVARQRPLLSLLKQDEAKIRRRTEKRKGKKTDTTVIACLISLHTGQSRNIIAINHTIAPTVVPIPTTHLPRDNQPPPLSITTPRYIINHVILHRQALGRHLHPRPNAHYPQGSQRLLRRSPVCPLLPSAGHIQHPLRHPVHPLRRSVVERELVRCRAGYRAARAA